MSVSQRIRFVLVGTQHPGNIGAAARAMKTMGLTRLVLVAPEKALDEDAYRRSAGAEDVLSDAPIFETLAEAVADCTLVIGCTARARRVALEELAPDAGASRAWAKAAEPAEVAIVFGRERTGLTNDELQLCHAAVHIPSDPQFSSLNLASAVQVLAYEVRLAQLAAEATPAAQAAPAADSAGPRELPASHAQMEGLFGQLGQTLDEIDFHKGRAPDSAMRKLRRLLLRAEMTEQEVRLLRGILADAQRMAGLARQAGT
ncbi:RNA methyltransferase [Xanthomonas campestris pv. campestris]|uniref:RNA methyltransferase n=1 Tax=Xanthomonas campestris TaxID=339 RepID=UPI001A148916|nr:RNA methyltransferase [Xanthomonas campestris]MBF9172181.1 RNA methyltransferase [Xanthomonas campestris pv. campestris]MDO0845163.1 RNA methyltransferase [Xanthomonas campestris pv. campestris]MEB1413532.1 RNA methyltransferase [Xanthomonas campestris pv. campestris]MEB1459402.1 RNA methyltransferase [Xanthomonas campestris pv. campestris]MEB1500335.1 RNA methyltransferase [Xanthomonas campestris pv. campestris]